MKERCAWCAKDPIYVEYHDTEWGCPIRDDRLLFEFLILEGMQAGLSWLTILRKRPRFREAFAGFFPEKVARFGAQEIAALILDPGIIRNQKKIEATVENARAFLDVQERHSGFSNYIWRYTGGSPLQNAWRAPGEVPCSTLVSDQMARDLKQEGFRFVGTKVCYAFMQATGMVNDHLVTCFRHGELG